MKQIDFESKLSVASVIVSIVLTILLTFDIWH